MLGKVLQNKKSLIVFFILAANGILLVKYSQQSFTSANTRQSEGQVFEQSRQLRSDDDQGIVDTEVHDSVQAELHLKTPPLILYNRVPKTGSTTFANIAYKLTSRNNFHMLHINVTFKNNHYLNILDQSRFVSNISDWREKQPAIYHGHLRFLDFTRFGYKNPIYINIIRDPVDRLVSYYYFLRYGDDYRPHLRRASAKDSTTLDECLVIGGKDCDLQKVMWMQVPFFCGQAAQCLIPDVWALEQAKRNLVNHYLLVGVTEQLGDFVALLEALLPQYFSGALDLYTGDMGHLRKTNQKKPPSAASLELIRQSKIYRLEQEFYEFAKEQFEFLKARTMSSLPDGRIAINPSEFKYEKIFPQN